MKNWFKKILPAEPVVKNVTHSFTREWKTTKGWFSRTQTELTKSFWEIRENGVCRVRLGVW